MSPGNTTGRLIVYRVLGSNLSNRLSKPVDGILQTIEFTTGDMLNVLRWRCCGFDGVLDRLCLGYLFCRLDWVGILVCHYLCPFNEYLLRPKKTHHRMRGMMTDVRRKYRSCLSSM
jgi:hypothetical protein